MDTGQQRPQPRLSLLGRRQPLLQPLAEAGGQVDLFSIVPVKRSHSVCAQGGINAAKNLKGEGDTGVHLHQQQAYTCAG